MKKSIIMCVTVLAIFGCSSAVLYANDKMSSETIDNSKISTLEMTIERKSGEVETYCFNDNSDFNIIDLDETEVIESDNAEFFVQVQDYEIENKDTEYFEEVEQEAYEVEPQLTNETPSGDDVRLIDEVEENNGIVDKNSAIFDTQATDENQIAMNEKSVNGFTLDIDPNSIIYPTTAINLNVGDVVKFNIDPMYNSTDYNIGLRNSYNNSFIWIYCSPRIDKSETNGFSSSFTMAVNGEFSLAVKNNK